MKKVIAGIDFSDSIEEICKFALKFASEVEAELIFATVIDDWDVAAVGKISSMGYNVDGDHYSDDVESIRIEEFKKMIMECGFPDVEKRLVIRSGRPAKELLRLIVKEDADAIIVGSKSHKDLEHSLELSVSEKILKKAPATVIAFRTEKHRKRLKKKIH